MAAEPALLAAFLLFAVAAPLALYALVRREAEDTDRMRRDEARDRVRRDREDR